MDIAKCKVWAAKLKKSMNEDSFEYVLKTSMKVGTKSPRQVEAFLSKRKIQMAKKPAPNRPSPSSGGSGSSSSSSSSGNATTTTGEDVPSPLVMNTSSTPTPRWTWQSALRNKSIMRILKTVMEIAKYEDYVVKLSYGNGNMKKYEFNGIR